MQCIRQGEGQAWLFLHAASSSGAAFRSLVSKLKPPSTFIMPDLLGDGASPRPDRWDDLITQELEALTGVLEARDYPAIVVGHSYGGVLAMEMARRFPERVKALVLIEPVAFHLLKNATHTPAVAELEQLYVDCEALMAVERRRDAALAFVSYWSGTSAWQELSEPAQHVLAASMDKVLHGWRQLSSLAVALDAYATIDCPTVIVRGARSPEPSRWMAAQLACTIPNARLFDVAGAGHMSPITHAGALAWLLTRSVGARPAEGLDAYRETLL